MDKIKGALFIDTSAFKALIDDADEFHQKALTIWETQHALNRQLVTSNYILDESFTLLRKRRGFSTVDQFREILHQSADSIYIARVMVEDEAAAWEWFAKDWSGLSFTDCVSFAQMQRLQIQEAFSFDKHFRRAGFKLV